MIVVLEGVPAVGKSSVATALLRAHAAGPKPRTVLHLTQAHTYGPLARGEDDGTLTVADNLAHLARIVELLEWLARSPRLLAIVDTLHVTHLVRPGVVRWEDVAPLDARLAAAGARIVFLHATPETLWARAIVARRGSQFLADYAQRRFGPGEERIHRHFVEEQERLRAVLGRSALPVVPVATDAPLDEVLARVTARVFVV